MAEDTATSSGESVYTEEEVTEEEEGEGQTTTTTEGKEGKTFLEFRECHLSRDLHARTPRRKEGGVAAGGRREPPRRRHWRVERGGHERGERRQGLGHFVVGGEDGRENEDGVRVERLPQQRRRGAPSVRRHQK